LSVRIHGGWEGVDGGVGLTQQARQSFWKRKHTVRAFANSEFYLNPPIYKKFTGEFCRYIPEGDINQCNGRGRYEKEEEKKRLNQKKAKIYI
jgi:hypothetical protein